MDPILISTNTELITTQKQDLDKVIPYFQSIYDELQTLGITATLQDLSNIANWAQRGNNQGFEEKFVKAALLAKAGTPNFNGVPIDQNKLADLISIPDITAFKIAASNWTQVFMVGRLGAEIALMQIVDNVIGKLDTAYATIEERNTHYTKTDASTQLATDLLVVCTAMNNFDTARGNVLKVRQVEEILRPDSEFFAAPYPLKVVDNQFVINLDYIRKFEAA
jgi:hypothetical protein